MTLTLLVTCFQQQAPNKSSITVDQNGCTIGRKDSNDLVLPDAKRIISQHHARIDYVNEKFVLTDNSTNGTYINHALEPVGRNNTAVLQDGDIVTIGEYECHVSIATKEKAIPFDELIQPLPDTDNDAPPTPETVAASALESAHLPSITTPEKPPWSETKAQETIPDDFDIFGPTTNTETDSTPLTMEHVAAEEQFFQPPEAIPEDWNAATPQDELHVTDTPAAPKPPEIPESAPFQAPAQHGPETHKPVINANTQPQIDNQQAIAAFLDGAQLSGATLTPEQVTETLHTAGQLLRAMTEGYKQILETRASLKNEFRLGMTTIRPAKNNPLKFSIDTDDALTKLLFPPEKGYLTPLTAVHEACDDVQAHQMATLSGLRVALNTLMHYFDPDKLEQDFQDTSVLGSALPFVKKAKYWELFNRLYQKAASDAENDFLNLLGDEFARAYEEQIQKLNSARQDK